MTYKDVSDCQWQGPSPLPLHSPTNRFEVGRCSFGRTEEMGRVHGGGVGVVDRPVGIYRFRTLQPIPPGPLSDLAFSGLEFPQIVLGLSVSSLY